MNMKANIHRDALYINGSRYTTDTVDQLPTGLKPTEVAHVEDSDEILFYKRTFSDTSFHFNVSYSQHHILGYQLKQHFPPKQ